MTTTTHSVAPEEIMAFLDGELSASEAQTVSAHLKDCAQCALVAEQFRATSEDAFALGCARLRRLRLEDSVQALAAKAAARTRGTVKSGRAGFGRRRWKLVIGSGGCGSGGSAGGCGVIQPSGQRSSPRSGDSCLRQTAER